MNIKAQAMIGIGMLLSLAALFYQLEMWIWMAGMIFATIPAWIVLFNSRSATVRPEPYIHQISQEHQQETEYDHDNWISPTIQLKEVEVFDHRHAESAETPSSMFILKDPELKMKYEVDQNFCDNNGSVAYETRVELQCKDKSTNRSLLDKLDESYLSMIGLDEEGNYWKLGWQYGMYSEYDHKNNRVIMHTEEGYPPMIMEK